MRPLALNGCQLDYIVCKRALDFCRPTIHIYANPYMIVHIQIKVHNLLMKIHYAGTSFNRLTQLFTCPYQHRQEVETHF